MRLLIAEDDPRLLKTLIHIFESNKFIADGVSNGADALAYAETEEYDGLILDIMMPKISGLEVLKQLRSEGCHTPVLLLTARAEVEDRIEGLDLGADDYLPKPFAMGELLARIRAMLRRRETFTPDVLTCADVSLNRNSYELCGNGQSVVLPTMQYLMMDVLRLKQGI